MAGIKNMNVVPGTGNPVQMQDLQNLWEAVSALCISKEGGMAILSGFAVSGNSVGPGVIVFQGQPYYLPPDTLALGQYLYAQSIDENQRVYEDSVTRYVYLNHIVNASGDPAATGIGTLIGQATQNNLDLWKSLASVINDGSITTRKLADGSVTTPKIADRAVTPSKFSEEWLRGYRPFAFTVHASLSDPEQASAYAYDSFFSDDVIEANLNASVNSSLDYGYVRIPLRDKVVATSSVSVTCRSSEMVGVALAVEPEELTPGNITALIVHLSGSLTTELIFTVSGWCSK